MVLNVGCAMSYTQWGFRDDLQKLKSIHDCCHSQLTRKIVKKKMSKLVSFVDNDAIFGMVVTETNMQYLYKTYV